MKLLVLSVSTGQGHNSTGAAVSNVFSGHGADCRTLDVFSNRSKLLGNAVSKGYLLSVTAFSGIYSKSYARLENRKRDHRDFTTFLCRLASGKLRKKVLDYRPDVIVCTHVFAALALKYALNDCAFSPLTAAIVTDFTIHPYWEDVTYLDYIVTASELLDEECFKKGFKPSQILSTGIPVHEKFSLKAEKSDARRSLGLDDDGVVITVMSGSMCYGGLTEELKEIDKLDQSFSVIAVCGSSKEELKKINATDFAHTVIKLGYTDKMNVILDASDCIITKPGGLSVSEALSKQVPMILSNIIPGHEQRNLEFLTSNGLAIEAGNGRTLKDCVEKFLTDSELKETLTDSAKKAGKREAAAALYEKLSDTLKNGKNNIER